MMVSEYGNNKIDQKLDINNMVDFVGSARIFYGRAQLVFWAEHSEERSGRTFFYQCRPC